MMDEFGNTDGHRNSNGLIDATSLTSFESSRKQKRKQSQSQFPLWIMLASVVGGVAYGVATVLPENAQRQAQFETLLSQKQAENDLALQAIRETYESGEIVTDTSSLASDAAYFEKCAAIAPDSAKPCFLAAAESMRSLKTLVDANVRATVEHDELLGAPIEKYLETDHLNKLVSVEKQLFNTSRAIFLFANDLPKTLTRKAVIEGVSKERAEFFTAELMVNLQPKTIMRIHEINMQVCDMLVEQHTFLLDRADAWSIQDGLDGPQLVFNDPQDEESFYAIMDPSGALLTEQDMLIQSTMVSGGN
ncbi:MAG: hypothetical protein H6815_03770 [Phycisphaeraceae bacterium]|nr:hypothetical protein [Phycisphaerales bacterium]MCB9859547.1 hypothetical protein [Phycisphaeraceae bacterium]